MAEAVELTAPAGSMESLSAALRAGANSVYFGVGRLNMRAHSSSNFSADELPKIVRKCRAASARAYLALNPVIYDADLAEMRGICEAAASAGVDGVIATDIAVLRCARSLGLPVHASVQLNICNVEALKFYSQFVDVVVLARELSLEQIRQIAEAIERENIRGPGGKKIRVEIFAHGALCMAISGKCYLSLASYNSSANRGACFQNCRRRYRVIDEENGRELILDNKYIMSPKDLCTIGFLDKILASGVSILKIEGRGRSPDYVYTVVKAYKEAISACAEGSFSQERVSFWMERLSSVFNRGFWEGGYYLGAQLGEWAGIEGSRAERRKTYVGRVLNYYARTQIAELDLCAGAVSKGAELLVTGPSTGALSFQVRELRVDEKDAESADKGSTGVTLPVPAKLRHNDKVYLLEPRTGSSRSRWSLSE